MTSTLSNSEIEIPVLHQMENFALFVYSDKVVCSQALKSLPVCQISRLLVWGRQRALLINSIIFFLIDFLRIEQMLITFLTKNLKTSNTDVCKGSFTLNTFDTSKDVPFSSRK